MSQGTLSPLIRAAWRVWQEGREHVPAKGGAILASNHLSFLDHFVMPATLGRQVFFISKQQHFDSPVKRFFFERWGVIPLRRGEGDREAFGRSVDILRRGDLFCIYPEGTRSLDGKLHKGHTGAARLALRTGAPVIPVAMFGTFEALPKGRSVPRLKKCGVRFGEPLDFSELREKYDDRRTLRSITDCVMGEIARLSGQPYVHEYQVNPEIPRADHQVSAQATHRPARAADRPAPRRTAAGGA